MRTMLDEAITRPKAKGCTIRAAPAHEHLVRCARAYLGPGIQALLDVWIQRRRVEALFGWVGMGSNVLIPGIMRRI